MEPELFCQPNVALLPRSDPKDTPGSVVHNATTSFLRRKHIFELTAVNFYENFSFCTLIQIEIFDRNNLNICILFI